MRKTESYIDTPAGLEDFLATIESERIVALDTEFIREKTYYPRLCLIQIATDDLAVCIDTLADLDLAPFFDRLLGNPASWVLHSARQDLEVLFLEDSRAPARLIDTQIAAALLGYAPQIGLQGLLAEELGVHVEKGHARTDWTRRPLPKAAIDYALDDVRYLLPLWRKLEGRLDALGRGSWFESDCANALAIPAVTPPEELWGRLRGLRSMNASQQLAALGLICWRERCAQTLDRPRRWIMSDDLLSRIARSDAEDLETLRAIPEIPKRLIERSGRELLSEMRSSRRRDSDDLLERYAGTDRPDKAELRELQGRVERRARELGIQSEVLATRREMSELLSGRSPERIDGGWRGSELQPLVAANA
jgi:ribonuclease D